MTTETHKNESAKLEAALRIERLNMQYGYPAIDLNHRWIVENIHRFDGKFIGGVIAKLQEEWK